MDPLQAPLHRLLGSGLDHAAVEGDHVVALDADDAEAEVGGARVDPHHYLHGKGFWEEPSDAFLGRPKRKADT